MVNYRGFADTLVNFRQFSLLIGKNSAGKSTVIEALRLLSLITLRVPKTRFENAPEWTGLPTTTRGIRISLAESEIDLSCVSHHYADHPAQFEVTLEDRTTIRGYLMKDESLFATINLQDGASLSSSQHLRHVSIPRLLVMPQVAPLSRREKLLDRAYVNRNQHNPVSRLHFRNQILLQRQLLPDFRAKAEASWNRLRILELIEDPTTLGLIVQDDGFPAEVGLMGSGLQVWLQMIWFLTRASDCDVVAMDEPDVYLHADLQRKLATILRSHGWQVVLTSHSVEIMSECRPSEMIIVDRCKRKSNFADSNTAVQKIIDGLGGVHNIQLARLWGAKKCLFVEGKDMEYLRALAKTIAPKKYVGFTNIPNFSTQGWSGLPNALGFSRVYAAHHENDFQTFCILDFDYRSPATLMSERQKASDAQLDLHVWSRKEIENYLLVPSAIARAIGRKPRLRGRCPTSVEIVAHIEEIATQMEPELVDKISHQLHSESPDMRRKGPMASNPAARGIVDIARRGPSGLLTLLCGSEVFARLNKRLRELSIPEVSPLDVAHALHKAEIDQEIHGVILRICA